MRGDKVIKMAGARCEQEVGEVLNTLRKITLLLLGTGSGEDGGPEVTVLDHPAGDDTSQEKGGLLAAGFHVADSINFATDDRVDWKRFTFPADARVEVRFIFRSWSKKVLI